jgi:hypothetical protein
VNRDAKTQSALIALARTRRMQRALSHAYLYRTAPMPTLRTSLGFMTSTASIAEDGGERGHTMTVLGHAPSEGIVYIAEELGRDDAPVVYRLFLRGPRQGHLVPMHAWTDPGVDIRAKIAELQKRLEPCARVTTEAWMLSTRIVQRRALRTCTAELPIRKFALQLVVEPVSSVGPGGKTTVTAFLHPQARLVEVFALRGNMALARVTYTGIPSGVGLTKVTVVLLSGVDAGDSHDLPGC